MYSQTVSVGGERSVEERLLLALDAADAFAWEWDLATGEARRWGDSARIVGPAEPDAEGFYAAVHPADRNEARDAMERAIGGDGRYEASFRLSLPGGARWVRDVGQVVRNEGGNPVRVVGVCFDDTRRRLEEERFRAVFVQTTAGICHLDPDGRFLLVNGAMARMLGRSSEEMDGHSYTEWIHPDDLIEGRVRFQALVKGAAPFVLENRFFRPDGTIVWLRTHLSALTGADGAIQAVQAVVTDIGDLVASRRNFERIAQATPDVLYVFDLATGRNEYANERAAIALGYPNRDLGILTEGWMERVIHPDDRARIARAHESLDALPDGAVVEVEYRMRHHDGEWRWFRSRDVVFERDAAGSMSKLLGLAQDITERRAVRQALKASEARFRAVQETTPDGFMVLESVRDADQKIVDFHWAYVNEAASRLLGQPRAWFPGRSLLEEMPQTRKEGLYDTYVAVVETGRPHLRELSYRQEEADLYLRVSIARAGDGFAVTFADLTERRRAEIALQESEERFRLLADASPSYVSMADAEGTILYVSESWTALTGLTADRMDEEGMSSLLHPDDCEALIDGYLAAVERQEPYRIEYRLKTLASPEYRWFIAQGVPQKDAEGRVIRWLGSSTDIHSEKTETERLEAMVLERTREVEGFCYSVSHDLRSPARAVMSTSAMILEDFGAQIPEEARFLLQRQAAAGKRMGELIDDLLELSRVGRAEVRRLPVDIGEMALAVAGEVFSLVPPERCRLEVAKGCGVKGDPRLIRLAVQNLLENAVKFSHPDRPNVVRVSCQAGEGETILVVADEGIGFDPVYASKIFEPFQRLHRDDEIPGTGIGLANVQRIAERHGGRAWAEGRPREGASFYLALPDAGF